jgi:hypothetical protein
MRIFLENLNLKSIIIILICLTCVVTRRNARFELEIIFVG